MDENLAAALRLLVVTDDRLLDGGDPVAPLAAAIRGGATAVQLRLKEVSDRELLRLARVLVAELPAPVFVNDRLDVALAAGAAGCHLGTDDLAPSLARRAVPSRFWLGASVGCGDEVARGAAASYWGIGPLRESATKPDAGAALDWGRVTALLAVADGRPCVVIGGVLPEDVPIARAAGLVGVAVGRGILGGGDPERAAGRYRLER